MQRPDRLRRASELRADIDNLKAALQGVKAEEAFVTAISPSNLELYYDNQYYGSAEEYLAALADAMHVEYAAIVDAGFVLQIDDPRMATHYNRTPDASIEDCRKFMALRVETVNHALRGIRRKTAFAFTPATASILRRACSTSSLSTSST